MSVVAIVMFCLVLFCFDLSCLALFLSACFASCTGNQDMGHFSRCLFHFAVFHSRENALLSFDLFKAKQNCQSRFLYRWKGSVLYCCSIYVKGASYCSDRPTFFPVYSHNDFLQAYSLCCAQKIESFGTSDK